MKVRSTRLAVEALEDRCVPNAASGDFNNDGLMDMAAITAPTTITVSLAKPDGSYTVSAILSAPKNQSLTYVDVSDINGDGNLDVSALSPSNSGGFTNKWLGNGDGTFDSGTTEKYQSPFGKGGRGGFW